MYSKYYEKRQDGRFNYFSNICLCPSLKFSDIFGSLSCQTFLCCLSRVHLISRLRSGGDRYISEYKFHHIGKHNILWRWKNSHFQTGHKPKTDCTDHKGHTCQRSQTYYEKPTDHTFYTDHTDNTNHTYQINGTDHTDNTAQTDHTYNTY